MSNKKYGLIVPESGTQAPKFQASRNVFGNDSDSDESCSKKLTLLRPSDNINRQAKITQEKAVIEDPTVYQYDEIYDEMVGTKEKEKKTNKVDAKPRYIENLMKSANKRKIENERRIERQIQKEREKEGEEFKDKEVFVTSAYKKKLEEMREEEEKEKREEYLETIGDVTKQRDLGGFYRHLYEQKLGSDKVSDTNKTIILNEDKSISNTKPENIETGKLDTTKKRNYRKRISTENKIHLSDGEIEDSDDEINRLNLDNIKLAKKSQTVEENIDADSDFSIDESDEEPGKPCDKTELKNVEKELSTQKSVTRESNIKNEKDMNIKNLDKDSIIEVKEKIDIWKKRTVGEVFDEALKRYYERKAARGH